MEGQILVLCAKTWQIDVVHRILNRAFVTQHPHFHLGVECRNSHNSPSIGVLGDCTVTSHISTLPPSLFLNSPSCFFKTVTMKNCSAKNMVTESFFTISEGCTIMKQSPGFHYIYDLPIAEGIMGFSQETDLADMSCPVHKPIISKDKL